MGIKVLLYRFDRGSWRVSTGVKGKRFGKRHTKEGWKSSTEPHGLGEKEC